MLKNPLVSGSCAARSNNMEGIPVMVARAGKCERFSS